MSSWRFISEAKFCRNIILLFSFVFFASSSCFSQNCSNDVQVITILQAGDCKNGVIFDNFIDSICKINNVSHLYYFIGVKPNEMRRYSLRLFGKLFDSNKIVSDSQIQLYNLNKIKSGNLVCYTSISHPDKIKVSNIYDFSELEIKKLISNISNTDPPVILNTKNNKLGKVGFDSFILSYSQKTPINSDLRLNKFCKTLKLDTVIYILDPLFETTLYRLNSSNSVISRKIDLKSPLVSKDSLLRILYKNVLSHYPQFWDTLRTYSAKVSNEISLNYYNIAHEGGFIYLTGDYELMTFYKEYMPITKSFRIVYKLDENLKLINYYIDVFLNYSNYVPDFYVLDNFSSDRIQSRLISDYDQETRKNRVIYYKLIDNEHLLYKYDKDSFDLDESFGLKFHSNYALHLSNFGNQSGPIWLLDPYPYFYFESDGAFFDFLNDTILQAIHIKSWNDHSGIISTHKIKESLIDVIYYQSGEVYRIRCDLRNRNILQHKRIGDLFKYNLRLSIDTEGKSYYYPIEESEGNNYFYFE